MEWARLIATLKNCTAPRKGSPFTVDEHMLTHRRPQTDVEINQMIRAAFGYYTDNGETGSPS